ncbi:hypothetical protein LSH36_2138g00006 [Paralvinella palmiformis]|uniref:Uncharacterized protein n=1 Tax=Paralvinella palmiformis TaxID=53620 RepID=A0AAD9IRE7_9ANNE|nr:hypothetical protein LSH36_2138g00006 [Paralvinella palmiformis]
MVTKPQELLPDNLPEFMRNVSVQLVSMATSLTLIPTTNQQQEYPKQENGGQKNIIKTMSSKLTELCKNPELITKLSQSKWPAFRDKFHNPRAMLIGLSILRDIDPNKLINTVVKCLD